MGGLDIYISWEWALGIIVTLCGSLLTVAWFGSKRFTALETSMEWVKETLKELKTSNDNAPNPAFASHSPINLTERGSEWLEESGLKEYVNGHKNELIRVCEEKRATNPYEVQNHIFKLFDTLPFEPEFEDGLKTFAYQKGTSMDIMRRVGAIYFRNLCIAEFGMNKDDIDKHDPQRSGEPRS